MLSNSSVKCETTENNIYIFHLPPAFTSSTVTALTRNKNVGVLPARNTPFYPHFFSTAESDSVFQVSSHLDGFPPKSTVADKDNTQVTDRTPAVINANII